MSNRIFKESQSYRGSWLMYLILLTETPVLLLISVLYFTADDKKEMEVGLGVVIISLIVILTLILTLKLETRIDNRGISFRYFPFTHKWKHIAKGNLKSFEVISYSPLTDYGGWGFKSSKTTQVYTVLGTNGILLDIGEKKKIMIGTMKPKELSNFMENWME